MLPKFYKNNSSFACFVISEDWVFVCFAGREPEKKDRYCVFRYRWLKAFYNTSINHFKRMEKQEVSYFYSYFTLQTLEFQSGSNPFFAIYARISFNADSISG